MKAYPIETAPHGRFILVKHSVYGWIEAMFDPVVYEQSVQVWGPDKGGFGWSNPGMDNWMYAKDVELWAELPIEEVSE